MHETRILAALRENYRSCTSYEDRGTVLSSITYDGEVVDVVSEFSTIFIRPNLLKFDVKTEEHQSVLQANGESIRSLNYSGGSYQDSVGVYPTLPEAISSFEGVSQGVLSAIFGLLEDKKDSSYYDKLNSLKRMPDATIDDLECHCISGLYQEIGTCTIWASKESNVLRRITRTVSKEASQKPMELARQFLESEGRTCSEAEYNAHSLIATIDFKQVTFNNSITIDQIG